MLDVSAAGRQGGAGRADGGREFVKGSPCLFSTCPHPPSTQESVHAGVQVSGTLSPTPGMYEHLNLDIYLEVQMLAWPIETQHIKNKAHVSKLGLSTYFSNQLSKAFYPNLAALMFLCSEMISIETRDHFQQIIWVCVGKNKQLSH